MADTTKYISDFINPILNSYTGKVLDEKYYHLNPSDYYNELYKEWGGLAGLEKMRQENGINSVISKNDFSQLYYHQFPQEEMEQWAPTYNPFEALRKLNNNYRGGPVATYVPTMEEAFANPKVYAMQRNGFIALSPNMRGRTDEENANSWSHELFHTLQPNTYLALKSNQEQLPWQEGLQPDLKNTGQQPAPQMDYILRPKEVTARMSELMRTFVRDEKTPVYDDKTANQFLNYMKQNKRNEYDYLNFWGYKDDDIKNLSKKIVEGPRKQGGPSYG